MPRSKTRKPRTTPARQPGRTSNRRKAVTRNQSNLPKGLDQHGRSNAPVSRAIPGRQGGR